MSEKNEPRDEDIASVILVTKGDKKKIAKIGFKKFRAEVMKEINDKIKEREEWAKD